MPARIGLHLRAADRHGAELDQGALARQTHDFASRRADPLLFEPSYLDDPERHTLSLSFKGTSGEPLTEIRPTRVRVPPFFSNLLPEGALRTYLARRTGVRSEREFPLLRALGHDLPGAVTVAPIGLATTDVLAADSRSIRILTNSLSVSDEVRVTQSAATSTNFAEAPESSDFEQGEMDVTLQPAIDRLTVQAANGDPATFDAFMLEEDNSVISFIESWDEGDYEFGSDERLPVLSAPR